MTIVEALRALACAIALYCLTWSFGGFRDLTRGRFWPPSFYLSTIFWIAGMTVSFQVSYLFGSPPIWRVFSFSMLISALSLAAWGHCRGYSRRARVLYAMTDYLGEAQAIVDLARLDRAAAERVASECRRLTVAAMVTRHD